MLLGARTRRWALAGTATIVVAVGSGLTWQRGRDYESSATLMSDTIAKNPQAWQAYYNLGVALVKNGKLDKAIACYKTAIELDPKNVTPHNNLGIALAMKGKLDEVIDCGGTQRRSDNAWSETSRPYCLSLRLHTTPVISGARGSLRCHWSDTATTITRSR